MRIYHKDALLGGGSNALDGIDGASLSDGDRAFVMDNNVFYACRLEINSFAEVAPPDVIAPVTNAGTKRWIRQTT